MAVLHNISGLFGAPFHNGDTLDLDYPAGTTQDTFTGSDGHVWIVNQKDYQSDDDEFTLDFGASTITLTNATGKTFGTGSSWILQLKEFEETTGVLLGRASGGSGDEIQEVSVGDGLALEGRTLRLDPPLGTTDSPTFNGLTLTSGSVQLIQKNGTARFYPITADTDAARGVALQSALAAVKVLADAAGNDGFTFVAPMTYVAADLAFYGVATFGGTSHTTKGGSAGANVYTSYEGWTNGVVYKITTSRVFSVLKRFGNTEVWNPQCGLLAVPSALTGSIAYLYGMGGENVADGTVGKVFRIRKSDGELGILAHFTNTTGTRPYGTPILATDNVIYFTCSFGGDGSDNDYGSICKFDPSAGTLTKLHAFLADGTEGVSPNCGLVQGADIAGNIVFYGVCAGGGANNKGTLFRYTPALEPVGLEVLHDFGASGVDGTYPMGELLYDAGVLIGTCKQGGTDGYGTVFKYVITGPTYTANWINASTTPTGFTGERGVAPGMHPTAGLIKSEDTHYYGTTTEGGAQNSGVVYKLDVSTGAYTSIVVCTKELGCYPRTRVAEVTTTDQLWWPSQFGGNGVGDICLTNRVGQTYPSPIYSAPGASANSVIRLGPGTYTIEPWRITYSDITLQGSGKDNTVVKCQDDTWYKGLFGGTWSFLSAWQSTSSMPKNIALRDMTVDCNVAGQTNEVDAAGVPTGAHTEGKVSFGGFNAHATESIVENVSFIHMGGFADSQQQIFGCWFSTNGFNGQFMSRGFRPLGRSWRNRIINCDSQFPWPGSEGKIQIFRNSGDGTDSHTEAGNGWAISPEISGCTAMNYSAWAGGNCIGFSGQGTQGLKFTNNSAYNLGARGSTLGIGFNLDNHPSRDTVFTGFTTDAVWTGVSIVNAVDSQIQDNFTLSGCHVRADDIGINLNAVTPGLRIFGNDITAPLGIDSLDRGSLGVEIRNNIIESSTTAIDTNAWAIPAYRSGNKTADGVALEASSLSVYGAGTAYSLTNTAAAVDFGTTDPTKVITEPGSWLISGQINLAYNGATVVAETATIKVRRTNNTAADVSSLVVLDLPVATTLTNSYGIFAIPPFVYTTLKSDDSLSIFANVSAALGVGTIDATAIGTSLVAIKLP